MGKPFITLDKPGLRGLAIGNEAIARGCFEAGVKMGSGYPGTPSSEILETFTLISVNNPEAETQLEWSINEKVGFEVALGGSMCNARCIASMKHVGVNVASDSFFSAAYLGVKGGLVLITADDPLMHSSQNEQDNRFYGKQALVPTFEPSSVQEAKDMMKYAYEFSEKYQSLVLYRTTTRLNHGRGDLILGPIDKIDRKYEYDNSKKSQWVNTPKNARHNKIRLLERIKKISEAAEDFPFNKINLVSNTKIGIISSGIPYSHTLDAINLLKLQDKVSTFQLGMVYPLPKKKLCEFMKQFEEIIVIEELEPIIEQDVKQIAFEEHIQTKIHGKDLFSQIFEIYPEQIIEKLADFFNVINPVEKIDTTDILKSPPRPPVLCAGCGHRNIYTAVRKVELRRRERYIHSSDIGCYTLGFYEPLNAIDSCIAMGASIGLANGIAKLDERVSMAFLGDSTFYHSGLMGLVNAVTNDNDVVVVIMDNSSTSMTGHQDHPGTGIKIDKSPGLKIEFKDLMRGIGIPKDHIWVPSADNLEEMETAFEQATKMKGVKVVIPTSLCALLKVNQAKKKKEILKKFRVITEECCEGEYCLRSLGCPAMSLKDGKVSIDANACAACSMCSQICPYYAIKRI
jgi:indolepyruvate ferredoxin oxidoreductase, alpha subunit